MAGRKHLGGNHAGIGENVLERPSRRAGNLVSDAGSGSVARLVLAVPPQTEFQEVRAVGLIRSRGPLPGWTVIRGYERLMSALGGLTGAAHRAGTYGLAATESVG